MPIIRSVRGFTPSFGKNCFIAETAVIIGDVIAGDNCTFWYGCVVRGDVNSIRLGNNVNVQDCAVIHATYQRTITVIGDNVSIGHHAVVHGARIGNNVLIGIGAIILDNAVIEDNVIIAAGAVVTPGTVVPSGSIFGGVPARLLRKVRKEEIREEIERIARNYPFYATWYTNEARDSHN